MFDIMVVLEIGEQWLLKMVLLSMVVSVISIRLLLLNFSVSGVIVGSRIVIVFYDVLVVNVIVLVMKNVVSGISFGGKCLFSSVMRQLVVLMLLVSVFMFYVIISSVIVGSIVCVFVSYVWYVFNSDNIFCWIVMLIVSSELSRVVIVSILMLLSDVVK